MSTFLYISGLIIGIAVFIYILSLYEAGKEKFIEKTAGENQPEKQEYHETGAIAFRNRPAAAPGTRICPICGSSLSKYEGLYASKISDSSGAKLMIMGCRYCYRENEESEEPKKSAL